MKVQTILIIISVFYVQATAQKSDCEPYTIYAAKDFFPVEKIGYVPFYFDKGRNALAVDSEKYGNSFAYASFKFEKPKGKYTVKINTVVEDDGEPTYKLFVNGKLIAEVQNNPSDENFVTNYLDFGTVKLKPGAEIGISFNAHTNGKIPEGESTAYARGRWSDIVITRKCK